MENGKSQIPRKYSMRSLLPTPTQHSRILEIAYTDIYDMRNLIRP